MSTTFGVKINKRFAEDANVNWQINGFGDDEIIIEIAYRSNGIRFTNPIAHLLPKDTPVVPMDNTAQGIETIADIIKEIEE